MSEVIVGIASAAFGFVSGLLTPWVKWQMEKRREQLNYRKESIKSWRTSIESEIFEIGVEPSSFLSSAAYSGLRVHLNEEAIRKVEAVRTVYIGGARGDSVQKHVLLDAITRLEKEWGLL
jgi:hypothetical protein